jgi:alpha-beta hydrolase superfamily lysophospholipase
MKHREATTPGSAGLDLFAQSWLPEREPQAVVVISHGLGEHSERYRYLAERLVERGHAVYALDHRGHGRSPGPRANIERFSYLVTDLSTFAGRSARQHPGRPVFLLGHSMGGAIATAAAAKIQDTLRGLVLSGPALAAGEIIPPLKRKMVQLLSSLAPNAGAMKLPPEAVCRDPEVVRAYEADPLVFHGSVPARTVAELLQAMDGFAESVLKLRLPLLVQHGIADSLVPLEPCRPIFQSIPSKDKTLKFYDGLFHEVYNEPEKDTVIGDLEAWLAARA